MNEHDVKRLAGVADVMARTMRAYAEIEGMKALNAERESQGHSLAYSEKAFLSVIDTAGLDHDSVVTALNP